MAGSEDELEAEALRQYAEELKHHVPGFAFSDIPRLVLVPCDPTEEEREYLKGRGITPASNDGRQTIDVKDRWRDPEQWGSMRAYLMERLEGRGLIGRIPKNWSYSKLVGNRKPERFDLSNPRIYSLSGRMVPWGSPPNSVGGYSRSEFQLKLVDVFRTAPNNDKRAEVLAYLEHHRTNGGNPIALVDHVRGILNTWKKEAPTYLDMVLCQRLPVRDSWQLLDTVEEWLKEAPKAATSAKSTGNAKSKRPSIAPPTLADKLGQVPGAAERFMDLVFRAGLCNASGAWIAGNDIRGKGKLIAMWEAVVDARTLRVPGFDTDTALVAALKGHFKGLEGLDRLDKVRKRYSYPERVEEYVADLQETI
jgi:hypothetical protein